MSQSRVPFTKDEDNCLMRYIATENPGKKGRSGKTLYINLCENLQRYPWAKNHSWQSWRERYVKNSAVWDLSITRFQKKMGIDHSLSSLAGGSEPQSSRSRIDFTAEDDEHLIKFIARENPGMSGRMGNALYQKLTDNEYSKWPWSVRHTWSSWRERYKNNALQFDEEIKKYQKKRGIKESDDSQTSRPTKPKLTLRPIVQDVEFSKTTLSVASSPTSSSDTSTSFNPKKRRKVDKGQLQSDERPYNKAVSDGRGERRVSNSGIRSIEMGYKRQEEQGEWPPRRVKKGVHCDPNPAPSRSRSAIKQQDVPHILASSPEIPIHHPFSQPSQPVEVATLSNISLEHSLLRALGRAPMAQLQVQLQAVKDKEQDHHPFSQVMHESTPLAKGAAGREEDIGPGKDLINFILTHIPPPAAFPRNHCKSS